MIRRFLSRDQNRTGFIILLQSPGCKVRVKPDEVGRFQLGELHFCFVYQSTALDESDFSKAIYLELETDNTEEMKQKILAFGIKMAVRPSWPFNWPCWSPESEHSTKGAVPPEMNEELTCH